MRLTICDHKPQPQMIRSRVLVKCSVLSTSVHFLSKWFAITRNWFHEKKVNLNNFVKKNRLDGKSCLVGNTLISRKKLYYGNFYSFGIRITKLVSQKKWEKGLKTTHCVKGEVLSKVKLSSEPISISRKKVDT